ncbi:hypothetical protein [Rhodovibrio sodomensis]|uniref:hypothetical protein n=1 Tax=Rhodovibrio sodomensis TaxID=1088 RepID=UPI001908816A|nr:hypothetical protein [Rhodovibrio sodomensis]
MKGLGMSGNNIAGNVTARNDEDYTGQESAQAAAEFEQQAAGGPIKQRQNSPLLIAGGAIVVVTLALVALIGEYA